MLSQSDFVNISFIKVLFTISVDGIIGRCNPLTLYLILHAFYKHIIFIVYHSFSLYILYAFEVLWRFEKGFDLKKFSIIISLFSFE